MASCVLQATERIHMKGIGQTIAKFRKSMGLSQAELAAQMASFGFSPSVASISSWEKDVSIPNALQFLAICLILNINDVLSEFTDEARGNTDNYGLFDTLNDNGRKQALNYIAFLAQSEEFAAGKCVVSLKNTSSENTLSENTGYGTQAELRQYTSAKRKKDGEKKAKVQSPAGDTHITSIASQKNSVRLIRLYDLPASAGTGEFLDGEYYEEVEAGADVPAAADFGIRIKGNSMEPRYADGQTVWVKKTNELDNGDIGIFFLDGDAYCKKLCKSFYGMSLISLNPKYKPIIINEDVRFEVLGKVLN